ncbi:MAG: phosphatase PAP2 family protein [Streptosporangiaceae bacterium]
MGNSAQVNAEAKIVDEQRAQGARPLLPSRARRAAAGIAVGGILVTVVLGALIAHTSHPDPLDRAVDSWIQRTLGGHPGSLHLLSDVGQPAVVAILTLAITLACLATRRLNGAVLTVVSVAASVVLTEFVLKPIVGRTLNGYRVYPSGHTGLAFTLATVIVVLLLNPQGRLLRRALIVGIAAIAALAGSAVAVAMIALDWHYFTDTVGGAALAIAVVLAISFLLDTEGVRKRLRLSSPAHRPASRTGTGPDATTSRRSAASVPRPKSSGASPSWRRTTPASASGRPSCSARLASGAGSSGNSAS